MMIPFPSQLMVPCRDQMMGLKISKELIMTFKMIISRRMLNTLTNFQRLTMVQRGKWLLVLITIVDMKVMGYCHLLLKYRCNIALIPMHKPPHIQAGFLIHVMKEGMAYLLHKC